MIFSPNCLIALEYFKSVLMSDYKNIYIQWQIRNFSSSWTLNNVWDLCYTCCLSRYVSPKEAALAADFAARHNFWIQGRL